MADPASLLRSFAIPSRALGPLPFWWWIEAPMTPQRVAYRLERLGGVVFGEACDIHLCPDGPAHGTAAVGSILVASTSGAGTICLRALALGARTPWYRVSLSRCGDQTGELLNQFQGGAQQMRGRSESR